MHNSVRFCLITLLLAISLSAQTKSDTPNFMPHNIGAGAGFVTGYGISYRHWFPGGYGLQLNLAPIINNTKNEKRQQVSAGLTGLKILKEAKVVNLFLYAGAHVHYFYRDYADTFATYPPERNLWTFFGVGPGFDIHFWHLSINIQAGIAGKVSDKGENGIQPTGETALFYSF